MKTIALGLVLWLGALAACDSDSMKPMAEQPSISGARKDSVIVPPQPIDSAICYTCIQSRYFRSDTSSPLPYDQHTYILCDEKEVKAILESGNYFVNGSLPMEGVTTCSKYR